MKVMLKDKNSSSEFSLLFGKAYDVESIEDGWYRIIDEDSDDGEEPRGYIYPPEMFNIVEQ